MRNYDSSTIVSLKFTNSLLTRFESSNGIEWICNVFIIVDVQSSISPLQYAETISRELRRLIEKSKKKKKRKNDRAFSFLLIPSEPLGW